MSFPLELVTLLGSSAGGGLLAFVSNLAKARQAERTYVLQALNDKAHIVDQARRYESRGFAWTRRIISLTAVFFVIAFPKLVAVYMPEVPVYVGYTEAKSVLYFFTSDTSKTVWKQMSGLVITPLDTHLLSAIIGLYFGGSLVK